MKMRNMLPVWIVAVLSLLFAAGCELDEENNTADTVGGDTSNGTASATVTFLNGNADPSSVDLQVNGKVTFKNGDSSGDHSITFTPSGVVPDTGDIGPNASVTVTFSSAGNYDFSCEYHTGSVGEHGVITVR